MPLGRKLQYNNSKEGAVALTLPFTSKIGLKVKTFNMLNLI